MTRSRPWLLLLPVLLLASPGGARAEDDIAESGAARQVGALLQQAVGEDPRLSWRVGGQLGKSGKAALKSLRDALPGASPAQALAIARALVLLEDTTRALEAARTLAEDEKAPAALRVAAVTLAEQEGDLEEADWLEAQLDRITEPEVRLSMARALWRLNRANKAKGKEVLLGFLRSSDADLRAQGALALGEIGAASEAKQVLSELRDEPSERGRTAALLLKVLRMEEQRDLEMRTPAAPAGATPPAAQAPAPGAAAPGRWPLLDEIREKLRQAYVEAGKADAPGLEDAAAQGFTKALDPHSEYLDPTESARLFEALDPSYGGVGAYVQSDPRNNEAFTISRPIFGGPVDRAGLRSGDVITAIDGESTEGRSLDECVRRLKGPAGTKVVVTVMRRGWTETRDVELARARIVVPTTAFDLLPGKVGFLQILSFSEETAAEVAKVLDRFEAEAITGLVIDLRYNGGGLLKSAVDIASQFLPAGLSVVTEKGRPGVWPTREYRSSGAGSGRTHVMSVPKLVLVNQFTASAAEILSGALQVHGKARLAGTMTYGKGSVQVPLDLDSRPGEAFTDSNKNGRFDGAERFVDANGNGTWDSGESFTDANGDGRWNAAEPFTDTNKNGRWDPGAAFKITVAAYYLPDGRHLHRDTKLVDGKVVPTGGLAPDVEPKEDGFDLWELQAQNQLEKADKVRGWVDGLFEADAEGMQRLARSDRRDPQAYPGFDDFYKGLDTRLDREGVRWLVRLHVRRHLANDLRRELVGDVVDDVVLQAALRDLFKTLGRDLASEPDLAFLAR